MAIVTQRSNSVGDGLGPDVAAVTLSAKGLRVARQLGRCRLHVHTSVKGRMQAERFESIVALTRRLFRQQAKLVFIAPTGVVVRAIASLIEHKRTDPAVVVVDVGGRYAISLLSGHEGGANTLALAVANRLGAEPIVTTTTEAAKTLIVGVGCRRGAAANHIVAAIRQALRMVRARPTQVRWLASASLKADEPGLVEAAARLGLGLRFIAAEEIRSTAKRFQHSPFVAGQVGLPAVAEPSALLAGRRTRLLLPKTIVSGVTVAVAEESCSWSASARVRPKSARAAPNKRSGRAASSSATSRTSISSGT
ncbi:MAG TPA: cobalamin biosynthesis protein [Alphaproteobacteria bacterium]|nr:cobalamin biosynthesis protein [Alphaproteobacteria bacterium]